MTVLVPGLHLLDEETYACAGLLAAITRLEAFDGAKRTAAPAPPYVGAHRAH
jgi:hypothetical protein